MSVRKKVLLGFCSLAVLAFLFLIFEHFRGPWLLNRWKARMAARGEALEIDQLAPRRLAPDDNGLPRLLWAAGQLGSFSSEVQPPAARYAAAGKVVAITKRNEWRSSDSKKTNITWVHIAEQLADLDPRIEETLEALQSEGFNANLHYQSGFNLMMPHLARLKSLAIFLSTAALHDLHQGQREAAFAKLKGLAAAVNILKDEPVLISQLVRIAAMHIGFAATWQALQHDGWSDAQLAELQQAWAAHALLPGMEKAIAMERAIAAIEYERFRTSDDPLSRALDPFNAPAAGPPLFSWNWVYALLDNFPESVSDRVYTPIWKFAWSHHDELYYCKTLQRMLEAQREAVSKKTGSALPARLDQIEETPLGFYDGMRFILARSIYVALSRSFHRAWIAQSAAEIAATAIAIKRFELRHGRLPCSLEELAPDFLSRCPIDYMDGQRLKYCLDDDSGFVLYSVGIDGKDHGGDGTHTQSGKPNFQYGRDLVWPRPASEIEILNWLGAK